MQGISELITVPGLINVDFADVRTIMSDTGTALMGIGLGNGENRALEAAKSAISSPLLDIAIDGARGILFTITSGSGLGMQEVAEAAKVITSSAHEDARVIFGAVIDETMGEDVRITVIATGFENRDRGEKVFTAESPEVTPSIRRSPLRMPIFQKRVPEPLMAIPTLNDEEDDDEIDNLLDEPVMPKPTVPIRNIAPKPTHFPSKPPSTIPLNPPTRSFTNPPTPPTPQFNPPTPPQSPEEADLEIPAFIRKKMGQ